MKRGVLLAFFGLSVATAMAAPAAPNFVVILGEGHGLSSTSVQMDDTVAESKSSYVRTPNFEKLAQDGMRFANFYAASPRCTPSLVTARQPPLVSTSAKPSVPCAPMRHLPHHLPTSGWSGAPAPHS